jgi:phage FluMu protein Com
MIKFKCPHCPKVLNVGDEYAGKKVRCPACKEVLTLPAGSTAVEVAPAPKAQAVRKAPPKEAPAPAPVRQGKPPAPKRRPVEEDDEDMAEIEAEEEEEIEAEEEDEQPRKKSKKGKRGKKGEFADCPECGSSGAKRVHYTWWGGVLGPRLLCHVKCRDCGTAYNGRTGNYNTVGIIIYSTVALSIAFAFLVGAGMFLYMKFKK